eukprot:CAMPEP_0179414240 /NCGR_PEP_ID=MMETSP0799-20121207/5552_1 /TAXON_ID=46947 /ORGANISM="Geminigera cryophila, Strain CCMP2564" /LENGTH=791 /DNA_ID=CAMNT_0021186817 /DNA_START=407 /DNA_END=2782 /DNA_ORIENTATION=-
MHIHNDTHSDAQDDTHIDSKADPQTDTPIHTCEDDRDVKSLGVQVEELTKELQELTSKLDMAEADSLEMREALLMRKEELKKTKEELVLVEMVLAQKETDALALKSEISAANKTVGEKDVELKTVREEMQAQLDEHQEDLEKAQAALAAATCAARADVRVKGGGGVIDEMTRQRRRVSRAATCIATEAIQATSMEDVISSMCPLVRQLMTAESCAIYLLLHPTDFLTSDARTQPTNTDTTTTPSDMLGGGGGEGGGGGGKEKSRSAVLRALVSGRAVEKYAANMMETLLPGGGDLRRQDSVGSTDSLSWEREELTHVMDLDLNINGAGLLAAALRADPDSVDGEGQAVMCAVPEEDTRYDMAVDSAYFQHWVVGEDKKLGATMCIAIRQPNAEVVGVMQVCRSAEQEHFEQVDVELLSEAARMVGMRHATLMLEHASFCDALDQAARPISRALTAGDEMLHELSHMRGLMHKMISEAAVADPPNAAPGMLSHLSDHNASPRSPLRVRAGTLPSTVARPVGVAATAGASPESPSTVVSHEGLANESPPPHRHNGPVTGKDSTLLNAANIAASSRSTLGAHGSASSAARVSAGGAVQGAHGVARRLAVDENSAGSVGSSSSSSNGVVAAHRDLFEREAAALTPTTHALTSAKPAGGKLPLAPGGGGTVLESRKKIERADSSGVDAPTGGVGGAARDLQQEGGGGSGMWHHEGGEGGLVLELPEMDEVFQVQRHARSLYDYDALEPDELSIRAGQKLSLLGIAQPGWFVAKNATGAAGLVPANYLQVLLAPGAK